MRYDIYGNPLQCGHCEVHPHVHEEYPCSVCLTEKQQHEAAEQTQYNQHVVDQHIESLREELEQTQAALRDLCGYAAVPYLRSFVAKHPEHRQIIEELTND